MKAVFIDTTRTGYAPDQCQGTLTVGEIIETLSQFDDAQPVYFRNDGGYTYGRISYENFEEEE